MLITNIENLSYNVRTPVWATCDQNVTMYCQVIPESKGQSHHGEEQCTWPLYTLHHTLLTNCYLISQLKHVTPSRKGFFAQVQPCRKNENMKINMVILFSVKLQHIIMDFLISGWKVIMNALYSLYHTIYLYQTHFKTLAILYFICSCYPTKNELMQWMLLNFIMFSKGEMLKKVKSLRKRGTYVVPTKYYAPEQKQ